MKTYTNASIYKITSPNTQNIYIGSTCQSINKRKNEHLSRYKKYTEQNGKYCSSFDIIQHGGSKMEIINTYSNITKKDLNRKEGETMKLLNNCINKNIAGRTNAEYFADNKVEIYQYKKTRKDCDCGGHYTNSNKNLHEKTKRHKVYFNIF